MSNVGGKQKSLILIESYLKVRHLNILNLLKLKIFKGWDFHQLIRFLKFEKPQDYEQILRSVKLYADCVALSQIPLK